MPTDPNPDPHEPSRGRISVVRGQELVPLLASTQDTVAEQQPWKGVLLEHHRIQPGEIPEHEHPELCLHLQLAGSDAFEWWSEGSNSVERSGPGSLILIPPGTRDRLRWQGPSERIIVSVDPGTLAELSRELGAAHIPEFHTNWSLQDRSLRHLVAEMGRHAANGWPLGALYGDLLTIGLQTHLLRIHATEPVTAPPLKGGMSLPSVRRAMEYINANLTEDVHLEHVAKEMGLSPSHFAHEFRNSTGHTPYQYLLDQRMARAKALLRTTRWPVQYISGLTGFRSPVSFVRAFRQRVGQTPDAWRKQS